MFSFPALLHQETLSGGTNANKQLAETPLSTWRTGHPTADALLCPFYGMLARAVAPFSYIHRSSLVWKCEDLCFLTSRLLTLISDVKKKRIAMVLKLFNIGTHFLK